ncbi:2-oxoglutarate dehydrogenase E1 component [Chthonomonas calidirosea]|uniref:2-oxoglutarate dehydrogenase E1 component n=1 Tax=Chthonomonas calidirosea TaxID=454171 RepID=UPI0006DD41C8|nr:2-oxoglutarate dehydrogenase E1 component [Chthonomonas calidirosea]CEK19230.1 2-oxoglutarate dehydrogenase E1 component [Chthonomonas calidirosea]
MPELSLFTGANLAYVLDLYERYQRDPESVDPETRAFFEAYPLSSLLEQSVSTDLSNKLLDAAIATVRLARYIRQRGHLDADIDPLHLSPRSSTELELSAHNLTPEILEQLPSSLIGGPIAQETTNARDAIARLRQVYSGTIGYEDEHIQEAKERYWLRDVVESRRFFKDIDAGRKRDLLHRLIEVDIFEDFLQRTFPGEKRFSIEGTDALVPMLDEIVRSAAIEGMHEVVMGMAHRGRLNVLAHVLGKPYEVILKEFKNNIGGEGTSVSGSNFEGWSGDVKYHLGYSRAFRESGVAEMPITLVPNPSHLEYVNPVVEGHVRAAQERRDAMGRPQQNERAALPILIHGDAAFCGQGIVAETLNLSRLPGYRTGGTIHIILNNQIGFTTLPSEGRSTLYASDLAKGFEIPIVHVNADDPIACIAAARMAFAYREEFGKDFLIDLIGYRRYGHNETDEPRTTQPRMYALIDAHPRVREIFAHELEKEGIVSRDEAAAMVNEVRERLRQALDVASRMENGEENGNGHMPPPEEDAIATGVSAETLLSLNEAMLEWPSDFHVNPRAVKQFYEPRRQAIHQPHGIYWAHAEALAFASILADGIPIRLTGQDTERGTFDQRRLALYDVETGERYAPLEHLPQARASFAVYNSPLSESAVLGFEYGYSVHAPDTLTLWEAQFGDFANGAQVIIDQFIAAGYAKWGQSPSLVLLLPHGYEGQGPEHSSARVERYLQLCAENNMRVVNCTTAAQYFHVLRRQAALMRHSPKPLVIFTPKSLLRDKNAAASLQELVEGRFQPVIDDEEARKRANRVTRLILCSGKVYMNLLYQPSGEPREEVFKEERLAVVRVEQLYPFPVEALAKVIGGYPNLRELVWLQEEPQNMGAWSFMEPRLRALLHKLEVECPIRYIGREESASTAEGSRPRHLVVQERILRAALSDIPALSLSRREAARIAK